MMDKSKMQEAMTHMKEHVTYPASKANIVAACNNMSHLSKEEKDMAMMMPDKTYNSYADVEAAMKSMM